jgi:hypothetical protein
MLPYRLPRFVVAKKVSGGAIAFYWRPGRYYIERGCTIPSEPLGSDYAAACGVDGNGGRARILNALFDEWRAARDGEPVTGLVAIGSVSWLFREYRRSKAFAERVSARTRPDYDRLMQLVAGIITKTGDTVGDRQIRSITPRAADKIYERVIVGPKGPRLRQGEKAIALCRHAWKVVHRLYPDQFSKDVPNPWAGVTKKRRTMKTKPAATREQVYVFARRAIQLGHAEAAGAAVICFEWLQRPENVLAGFIRWTDYRPPEKPTFLRIEHAKTGAVVWHPLEEVARDDKGNAAGRVLFYPEAEAVLAQVPRRGVPMILRRTPSGAFKPYNAMEMARVVRRVRVAAALPAWFTLDSCRHGGMTEIEAAGLTDGQGRALSGHRSKAYEGYAKRTDDRALIATKLRHRYVLAEQTSTDFRNEAAEKFRNDPGENESGVA